MNQTVLSIHDLSPAEKGAYSLSRAALQLDGARMDKARLAPALKHFLDVWVAFRGFARQAPGMDKVTRDNILKLSHYVSNTIIDDGLEISRAKLDTLININLQISEGLLEGGRQAS